MLRYGFECLFSTTLLRGTGTGTADDLHDNVLNVCVPPMWQGLTLVHFSAQRKRFCGIGGAFRGCLGGV